MALFIVQLASPIFRQLSFTEHYRLDPETRVDKLPGWTWRIGYAWQVDGLWHKKTLCPISFRYLFAFVDLLTACLWTVVIVVGTVPRYAMNLHHDGGKLGHNYALLWVSCTQL